MLDRLGHGLVTAELLQPDELVSGMMAQIAADPLLAQLLTSFIYSSEGPTLLLSIGSLCLSSHCLPGYHRQCPGMFPLGNKATH